MDFDDANPMVLPRFISNSLYITDLDPTFITEKVLLDLFSKVGTVMSVKLCTNLKSSHAYVNFNTIGEACSAWQTLNYQDLNGTPMRILFSDLDPASRYNQNANLIIKNLEESIDSENLHHTFSTFGVVISAKVKRDSRGKSLECGFIQFQDEEDAQRAIRLVNGKLMEGKQVYLGPFIPRSIDRLEAEMNFNPLDLNTTHNSLTVKRVNFGSVNEVLSSMSSDNSSSNSSVPSASDYEGSDWEVDDGELSSDDDDNDEARLRARARAEDMIKAARAAILAEKRAANPHIDPAYVPSSKPWAPQPWSVETLRANLASAHLPEERIAMLNGTLLPLVWKYTESFDSDVTKELVKMDIEDIAHLLESPGALQEKVEATKKMILEKIWNQAPFVPKTPPTLSTSAPADEGAVDPIPVGAVALLPLQVGTGVFNLGRSPNFRKGTGFFDVSQTQHLIISNVEDNSEMQANDIKTVLSTVQCV